MRTQRRGKCAPIYIKSKCWNEVRASECFVENRKLYREAEFLDAVRTLGGVGLHVLTRGAWISLVKQHGRPQDSIQRLTVYTMYTANHKIGAIIQ